jgi:hypothetical protein
MNVGAERPEDAGLYFSWGNIEGVSADDAAAVAAMTEAAYATTPGASINHDLTDAREDAAMAIMGINWCIPDDEDIQELIDECNWEWVTVNGVNGYRITSKQPGNTNSIFLPAVGEISDGTLFENQQCVYWTNKYIDTAEAQIIFGKENQVAQLSNDERYIGCTIRARLA